jgi:hypothetical protein
MSIWKIAFGIVLGMLMLWALPFIAIAVMVVIAELGLLT